MKIEIFLQLYESRLDAYVSRFIRSYRLQNDMFADLRQTALLSALTSLSYWRANAGRNAFNFCAPAMLKAMRRLVRSELRSIGKRVCLSDAPVSRCKRSETCMGADILDLRRVLYSDPKPQQLVRFIATALSPASGGDLARADGLSRQAFYKRQKGSRERLLSSLG